VLCGCETLREEHTCIGCSGRGCSGTGRRELCDEELHDFCFSRCYKDDKVNEDDMRRARGTYGREGKRMKVFCGKTERRRPLTGPRRRCEDIRKMDIDESRSEGVGCIRLFQEREKWSLCVRPVMNLPFP
jgi:hypothetical protein